MGLSAGDSPDVRGASAAAWDRRLHVVEGLSEAALDSSAVLPIDLGFAL